MFKLYAIILNYEYFKIAGKNGRLWRGAFSGHLGGSTDVSQSYKK